MNRRGEAMRRHDGRKHLYLGKRFFGVRVLGFVDVIVLVDESRDSVNVKLESLLRGFRILLTVLK